MSFQVCAAPVRALIVIDDTSSENPKVAIERNDLEKVFKEIKYADTKCHECGKFLYGRLLLGYECTKCKKYFHEECLGKKRTFIK